MFKSARIKLTAWYLVIIMVVSALFSFVIYQRVAFEMERGFRRAELRLRAEEQGIKLPAQPKHRPFFTQDVEAVRRQVFLFLLYTNGVILVFSAGAGYWLAGKTLAPIERTLDEQKRFVADASHELRTPLTALRASMEVVLRDKKMSLKEAKRLIKSNLEDVEELATLSNNLLNLANYQSNSQKLVFEKVDITGVVDKAYRKISPLSKKREVSIKLKVKSKKIPANKESLEKMVVIFLDNAVKYTPKGGKVTVSTQLEKNRLVLKIADTGFGIAEKDIPHIFDRFYRTDQSRSKVRVSGFGLGLSLAKRIANIHQGLIEVESVLGKGTTFTIKLPLKHS